jgi:hypothetical protein
MSKSLQVLPNFSNTQKDSLEKTPINVDPSVMPHPFEVTKEFTLEKNPINVEKWQTFQ